MDFASVYNLLMRTVGLLPARLTFYEYVCMFGTTASEVTVKNLSAMVSLLVSPEIIISLHMICGAYSTCFSNTMSN